MKVAIATQFPECPENPHGGVEAVSVNLVRALAKLTDVEVHVVTMNSGISSLEVSQWEGATVHRLPRLKSGELANAIGYGRRMVSEYLIKLAPDVVHAHDTYGLMVKGLPIPRVFTIHGFIYGDTLVSGRKFPWVRSMIWRWIETSGWADQPNIISISPYVRERLTGIATGAIYDIDNPISDSFFQIARKEKKGVIFSAAVISTRKNTLMLIKAFANVISEGINAELRLAGPVTNADYGRAVHEFIKVNNLSDKVVLLGRIGTEEIKRELSSANIFSLVSLEENSPMGIEEAMAAGIPVVTSNRCGMPYMVRSGETGYLVNPNDPADIACRLKRLILDADLCKKMGELGRTIALDRFHPDRVAIRTKEVYLEAIDRRVPNCNR